MKQCPTCKTAYTDDSLRFCLADGTALIFLGSDAPTARMNFSDRETMRVNVPADSVPTVFAPPLTSPNQTPKKSFGLIIAGLCAALLLLIGGLVAAYVLLRSSDNQPLATAASPTPTASPTAARNAAPNDENARLREEMANLKKELENQKRQKSNPTVENTVPLNSGRTARANSPSDGFLALRSEPNSETGYRIAKIPHGAALTVYECPTASNVGKMPGRWCRVNYEGQSGWAFDGFMTF